MLGFQHKNIFSRFGCPCTIIKDGGSHFYNKLFSNLMAIYSMTHKVVTTYNPWTSGQVEMSSKELKKILQVTVSANRKDWSNKLDDVLGTYRTTYKIPIGTFSYTFLFEKPCHLPIKLEH